jgi:hypothetical protein
MDTVPSQPKPYRHALPDAPSSTTGGSPATSGTTCP